MDFIHRAITGLFCLCALVANAQSPLLAYEITSDTIYQQGIDNRYWQVLEDKEGKWSINDVHSQPLSNKFHNDYAKSSFRDSMVYTQWVRCRLHNSMATAANLSMSSGSGLTDFYLINEKGKINHFTTGWQYPWRKKDGLKRHNAIHFVLNRS